MPSRDEKDEGRLARIETIVEQLEARLFGGDGGHGVVDDMEERLRVLESFRWKALAVIGALMFLTGSGVGTLQSVVHALWPPQPPVIERVIENHTEPQEQPRVQEPHRKR